MSAVSRVVRAAADAELRTYSKYGEHAEAKEASQAAMMWNLQATSVQYIYTYIYIPIEIWLYNPSVESIG